MKNRKPVVIVRPAEPRDLSVMLALKYALQVEESSEHAFAPDA